MSRPEAERAAGLLARADADLAADHELGLPEPLRSVEELYPYAVQLRYDAPVGEDPLDRPSVRKLLERLRAWATDQISRV